MMPFKIDEVVRTPNFFFRSTRTKNIDFKVERMFSERAAYCFFLSNI